MLTSVRLPVAQQNTTSAAFVPISGAEAGFSVIEKTAVVELEFAASYQHDATVTPGGSFDLPAVQGEVTVLVPLLNDTNWHVLPFDQIDVENDTTVMEFNGGTNAVDIKQTGLYEIQYTIGIDPSGASTYATRFIKNGTTVIPGSVIDIATSSQHTEFAVAVLHEFTAGDFVQIEYNSGGATGASIEHAVANIIRLQSAEVASAGAAVDLTFEINGVDVALPYTNGLISHRVGVEAQQIDLRHRLLLDPGYYTVRVMWRTNNATGLGARLRADVYPADLSVEVRSHPGTLAHGVDAKQHGVY